MGSRSLFLNALFGTLAVMGLIYLLLIGGNSTTTLTTARATANLKASARDKFIDLDVNYLSKRRIPNGPDPIHNRRAGNSGRPPGRS